MNSYPIDHIAIATSSIREASRTYELLTGETCSPIEDLPDQGVRAAFVGQLELIEPLDPEGGVARFLNRRGPGLHHVAVRVPDIAAALAALEEQGFELIDHEARPGAGGHRVAFIHPRSTGGVLWELVEADVTAPR